MHSLFRKINSLLRIRTANGPSSLWNRCETFRRKLPKTAKMAQKPRNSLIFSLLAAKSAVGICADPAFGTVC
jgi:hypothetical protein